jgi:hypothetical protein
MKQMRPELVEGHTSVGFDELSPHRLKQLARHCINIRNLAG